MEQTELSPQLNKIFESIFEKYMSSDYFGTNHTTNLHVDNWRRFCEKGDKLYSHPRLSHKCP